MKHCPKCKKTLSTTHFAKNKKRKDGLQSVCRVCQKDYNKTYYAKPQYKEKVNKRNRAACKKISDYIRTIKERSECSQCGFSHPDALQFHHTDPSTKFFSIAAHKNYSLATVKKEMTKCVILCANCHFIFHAS